MPANEVNMVYQMNKEAKITIDTPVGKTNEISVENIVRQGTIYGPVLCGISTDKVNKVGETVIMKFGDVELEPMTYVDDILGAGDKDAVETTIENCRKMEEMKKMTFNNEKSQYQIINFSKCKTPPQIIQHVKRGQINQTHKYRYLGDMITDEATNEESIRLRTNKTHYMKAVIKKHASKAGPMYIQVVNKLYQAIANPMITYNTETWTNITTKDINELEKIQKTILIKLYKLPKTTPYYGILSEVGMWTVEIQIQYKKLLLLHTLLNSDDERIAKKVLLEQMKQDIPKSWYPEVKRIAEENEIDLAIDEMTISKKGLEEKNKNEAESKDGKRNRKE